MHNLIYSQNVTSRKLGVTPAKLALQLTCIRKTVANFLDFKLGNKVLWVALR
jgi:hypothetical protein